MIRDIFKDSAIHLHRDYPETMVLVGSDPTLYTGKGNLCQVVAIEFSTLGISRTRRLEILSKTFDYPNLTSMKQLSVGELRVILAMRSLLRELDANS